MVGIYASAGGLDAFKRFIKSIPANTGLVFLYFKPSAADQQNINIGKWNFGTLFPTFPGQTMDELLSTDCFFAPSQLFINLNPVELFCQELVLDGVLVLRGKKHK